MPRFGPPRACSARFSLAMERSPGFGSIRRDSTPFRTRVRSGSACPWLSLATTTHSPAHSTKGTPSPHSQGLRPAGSARFQVCFTPLAGVLFTFPSRYWCTIGRFRYLALDRGRPSFPPGSSCRAVLTFGTIHGSTRVATGLSPAPATRSSGLRVRAEPQTNPLPRVPFRRTTPERHRRQAVPPPRFGLLPVRSPLLRESSLFLGVLRCFSSPGARALSGALNQSSSGLPHSETSGSPAASASPEHFVAWPRPSSAGNA